MELETILQHQNFAYGKEDEGWYVYANGFKVNVSLSDGGILRLSSEIGIFLTRNNFFNILTLLNYLEGWHVGMGKFDVRSLFEISFYIERDLNDSNIDIDRTVLFIAHVLKTSIEPIWLVAQGMAPSEAIKKCS